MNLDKCNQCGSIFSVVGYPQKFEELKGHEHVKRGLEVAMVGNHTVGLVGVPGELEKLASLGLAMGLVVRGAYPCPCGYYGSNVIMCGCSRDMVQAWQLRPEFQAVVGSDIVINVLVEHVEKIQPHYSFEPERTEVVMERVSIARKIPAATIRQHLDDTGKRLMNSAYKIMGLNSRRYDVIIKVATSICKLGGGVILSKRCIW